MTEPHPGGEHWVAQEGAFSAATSAVPVLHYFPARGRAEPIRLVLALERQPWFEPPAGPLQAVVRLELDGYPFRQMPRFVDEITAKIDIVQSMAILRHLGRKYRLYGGDLGEAAAVDMLLDAASELRAKLKGVVLGARLSEAAVAAYTASSLAPEAQLVTSSEPGPGLACLERLLTGGAPQHTPGADEGTHDDGGQHSSRHGSGSGQQQQQQQRKEGGDGAAASAAAVGEGGGADDGDDLGGCGQDGRRWFVGDAISIADVAVADLVDLHLAYFEPVLRQRFPALMLHHRRVMGQPGIKDYLASNNRHRLLWGQDWIDEHAKASS